jgi:DNA-binding transcriptional MerR regulator
VRIGELAAQTGVPVRTIRFYEQTVVLPAPKRTSAGYRANTDDTATRLRFVLAAALVVIRRLIGRARTLYRWPTRPTTRRLR